MDCKESVVDVEASLSAVDAHAKHELSHVNRDSAVRESVAVFVERDVFHFSARIGLFGPKI